MSGVLLRPGQFDIYIREAMDAWAIPGLAIAVVTDDATVLAKGCGLRNVQEELPVDARTMFAVGSTTKAFTATALAMLVEEDKLAWDDRVSKHLPGFQMFDPWVTREITVRDLLTHQSGLPRFDAVWYGTDVKRDAILDRVRRMEPSWSFRSKAGYQNIMYLAAGQIVEAATGQSWDDFVHQRIFRPLGMRGSNTSVKALQGTENVATPYAEIEGAVRPLPWRNLDNIAPAGSINSNVVEMAQWLRLHLGEGMYEGEQLLSPQSVKEMQTPQFLVHTWDEFAPIVRLLEQDIHFWAYGLGWFLNDYRGKKLVWHLGGIDGMSAVAGLIPEERVGVVILTNMHDTWMHIGAMLWVFDSYLGASQHDWCSHFLPLKAPGVVQEYARVAETSPTLPLSAYTGIYYNEVYADATVSEENGKLVLSCSDAYSAVLDHWHYDTFCVTWRNPILGKAYVTFSLDKTGVVDKLKVDAFVDGSSAVYERRQLTDSV